MTFHGGTRRRSRRAFDTLDAQVNCNRERRGLVVSADGEIERSASPEARERVQKQTEKKKKGRQEEEEEEDERRKEDETRQVAGIHEVIREVKTRTPVTPVNLTDFDVCDAT